MELIPMDNAPKKTEFLERIRTSRTKLDEVVKSIDPMFMTAPGVCGDWSVKDILAHITWHEQEMFNVVLKRALVGSDLWNVSLELRNKTIYEENRDRGLKDVLDDYQGRFRKHDGRNGNPYRRGSCRMRAILPRCHPIGNPGKSSPATPTNIMTTIWPSSRPGRKKSQKTRWSTGR